MEAPEPSVQVILQRPDGISTPISYTPAGTATSFHAARFVISIVILSRNAMSSSKKSRSGRCSPQGPLEPAARGSGKPPAAFQRKTALCSISINSASISSSDTSLSNSTILKNPTAFLRFDYTLFQIAVSPPAPGHHASISSSSQA